MKQFWIFKGGRFDSISAENAHEAQLVASQSGAQTLLLTVGESVIEIWVIVYDGKTWASVYRKN